MLDPLLKGWALSLVVLFLKVIGVGVYQGYHRNLRASFTNVEDARVFGVPAAPRELPPVERGQRVLRNDVENIPLYLFLGLAYMMTGGGQSLGLGCFTIFTVSRLVHTISYLGGWQPWRTVSYIIGVTSCLMMSGQIVLSVLTH